MASRETHSCCKRTSGTYNTALTASCIILAGFFIGCRVVQGFESKSIIPLHVSIQPNIETAYVENVEPVKEVEVQPEDPDLLLLQALRELDGPAGKLAQEDISHWQVVRMKVTAYCACRICCGKNSDGVTANCHRIRRGDVFVAADKKVPFGTKMMIPGYNNGDPVEVKDRGRLIKGNRLDVFFNSHSRAKRWGVKNMDVLVKVK